MKKIYSTILSVLTVGALVTASAQQQPTNPGFEDWDDIGSGNFEPTAYNGMMTGDLCGFCGIGASQRIFKDVSDFHGGLASARLESIDFFTGDVINGTMSTGQIVAPSTTPSEGYTLSDISESNFSHAFTGEPDSLVFWAKYNVTNSTDSASVAVILHENVDLQDPGANNANVIASAKKRFQTGGTSQWVRISVPFEYTGGSLNPVAYALITFTASYSPGEGSATAKLWVDDFEFIYSPVTSVVEELAANLSVYPNPTNDGRITVSFGNESLSGTATILNMMGQTVGAFNFSNENLVNIEIDRPAGMYFINVRTEDGQSTTLRVIKG